MIKLKFGILLAMLAVTTTAFAGYSPANVQAALKKMYPDAKDIAWSQDDGYYCADFMMNGLEKNVWFNTQAQWVMIQTELISTDRLTPPVYNAFAASNPNVDIKYQLFYAPNGEILRTRNVSDMYDILGPKTFIQ